MAGAARSVVDRLAHGDAGSGRELEATLLRLGFPLAEVAPLVAGRALPVPARRAEMTAALDQALAQQSRAARARRPTYDLNRHIAVFRAVRQWIERTGTAQPRAGPAGAASRPASTAKSSSIAADIDACIRR